MNQDRKFAVMQPYFMPYIGYFQLMRAVDVFVVYDNVQFIKNGWINRNRFLHGKDPKFFTVPVSKGKHDDLISERHIAAQIWHHERKKVCSSLRHAYSKARFFDQVFPLVESCLNYESEKILPFVEHSLLRLSEFLGIKAETINASDLPIDQTLKGKHKLFAIGKHLNIDGYINPEGGQELYDKEDFLDQGLNLSFLRAHLTSYKQLGREFVPGLSIIDVMMFNGKEETQHMLDKFTLI